MSKPNLPELPPIPWKKLGAIAADCVSAEAIHDYATAYAEEAVRQALAEAAARLEALAQEAFERPGVAGTVHMAYHQAAATILASPPETRDE